MDIMKPDDIWNNWGDADSFSGVFSVSGEQGVVFEKCCGYRNRSENLPNNSKLLSGSRPALSCLPDWQYAISGVPMVKSVRYGSPSGRSTLLVFYIEQARAD